jgi:thioredoxin-related protein
MRRFLFLFILSALTFSYSQAQLAYYPDHITWLSIDEALKLQQIKPKKIIIDVYTEWCGWCKKMDNETFSNPILARYINENYYAVKFDAEQKKDIVFKGITYSNTSNTPRSPHQFAAFLLNNKMGYPSTVYLDEQLNLLTVVQSYLSAPDLEPIVAYFATNSYRVQKWEDYRKNFTSQLNR